MNKTASELMGPFKIHFFFKKDCPKCGPAKIEMKGIRCNRHDLDTVDGLTEAAWHSVLSTPTVIVYDEKGHVVRAWHGEVPKRKEVLKWKEKNSGL